MALRQSKLDPKGPTVPRLCPGGTVVCLGCGPSLTAEDVDYCHGKASVIAVNDAWRLAPWADALMASDAAWWFHYKGVPKFAGLKYCLERSAVKVSGVTVLQHTGESGLEMDPRAVRTGRNSGAAAINVAVHFGASRVLLLGYDMQASKESRSHFFGAHPKGLRGGSPYPLFRRMFDEMSRSLAKAGISVVNCSRDTALTCFPRAALRSVL